MTNSPSGVHRERAIRHEARARNYRRQAEALLQRDADCAGALIYEAAKQCINAVANQRGSNPATIGGKINVLRALSTNENEAPELMRYWQGAERLHIHADRGNLDTARYDEAWAQVQAFIDTMLAIYHRDT